MERVTPLERQLNHVEEAFNKLRDLADADECYITMSPALVQIFGKLKILKERCLMKSAVSDQLMADINNLRLKAQLQIAVETYYGNLVDDFKQKVDREPVSAPAPAPAPAPARAERG